MQTRSRRWLAGLAAPVAFISMLMAPATAATAPRAPAPSQAMALPQLTAPSYRITLITGDTVTLSRAAAGRYTVAADQASSPIQVTGRGGPSGTTSLSAQPVTASALVSSGQLDRGLFDVLWLARHPGSLPLVLRFGGQPNAAGMTRVVSALPGARITATGQRTVNVAVAAGRTGDFWRALTGLVRSSGRAIPAKLAGGITRVWLAGHHVAGPRPLADAPGQSTVAIDLRKNSGEAFAANGCGSIPTGIYTLCVGSVTLLGVAGGATGKAIAPTSVTCLDENPCTTYRAVFRVPVGVYDAESTGFFFTGQGAVWQNIDLVDPQFTVAGDTHIVIDADAAKQVTARAPRPTEQVGMTEGHFRSMSDGSWLTTLNVSPYGMQSDWVVTSSTAPISLGTFHMVLDFTLMAPPVTMAIAGPHRAGVHAIYPDYNDPCPGCQLTSAGAAAPGSFTRFSGSHTYDVVDAGYGTPADFAGLDARGKLVLMRLYNDTEPYIFCGVQTAQLDRAIQAGAAGVIIDPSKPDQPGFGGIMGTCMLPVTPQWWWAPDAEAPDMPVAETSPDDATAIRNQLRGGSVRITVTDGGTTPYLYQLSYAPEGRLPATETYQVDDSQLTVITANIHASSTGSTGVDGPSTPSSGVDGPSTPRPAWHATGWAAERTNDFVSGGGGFVGPARRTIREYIGPDAPSTVWMRSETPVDGAGLGGAQEQTFAVFADPGDPGYLRRPGDPGGLGRPGDPGRPGGSATEDWGSTTLAPGALAADMAAVTAAQPDKWTGPLTSIALCSYCRQGNTFYPIYYQIPGANPRADDGAFAFGYGSTDIHLYDEQGNEVPQSQDRGFAAYTLPAARGRYRLAQDSPGASTTWDFTSSAVLSDQAPAGFTCFGSYFTTTPSTAPCRADPLILLRYNPFTDLANTVAAPGTRRLQVDAYYQGADHPAVTGLKLWISTDDGTTWQRAAVSDQGGGSYLATYTLPALPGGQVSLKASATDSAGGDVSQVIKDAFAITG